MPNYDDDDRWIHQQVVDYEWEQYESRKQLDKFLLDLNVKFPYNMLEVDEKRTEQVTK